MTPHTHAMSFAERYEKAIAVHGTGVQKVVDELVQQLNTQLDEKTEPDGEVKPSIDCIVATIEISRSMIKPLCNKSKGFWYETLGYKPTEGQYGMPEYTSSVSVKFRVYEALALNDTATVYAELMVQNMVA